MRIKYNDDNTNKGVEGWFDTSGERLVVYVKPTNSLEDWVSAFIAFRSEDEKANCKVHHGYKKYIEWLYDFIVKKANVWGIKDENVYLIGVSMGGGIVQGLGECNVNWNLTSIDGPRTTTELRNKNSVLYYNKGSLVHNVPFWFEKIENQICLNKKWRPFWVSHSDYDIEKITSEVLK